MSGFEHALAARLAAAVDNHDDSDWLEVQRRVRYAKRRRLLTISLAAAVAVMAVGPALAFRSSIIDFFSADPAPQTVVRDFGAMQVLAPAGMAPGAIPGEARRVTSVRIDGKEHVLYVAPTAQGGFCVLWTEGTGGCRATRTLPAEQAARLTTERLRSFNAMGLTFQSESEAITVVSGHLLVPDTTVELRYEDGQSDVIPYLWVSKPIDAGFFLFRVPDAHREPGHRASEVVLLDAKRDVIARDPVPSTEPTVKTHRLDDGTLVSAPARAIWAERHIAIDFRARNGQRITLWVAPAEGGGQCYWWNQGSGCPPPVGSAPGSPAVNFGLAGGGPSIRLFGSVAPEVATVKLNYEDGSSDTVKPAEGFVLVELAVDHYLRGHRLVSAVGFDALGVEVGRSEFQPKTAGIYPCSKPDDYGYGVKQCP